MIKKVGKIYSGYVDEFEKLNCCICENPELEGEEVKTADVHTALLKKYGFQIEREFLGMETAFKASYKSEKKGPKVAFLTEYGEPPEAVLGCGNNILGAASTGAGIVLRELLGELGGEVVVYGAPVNEANKIDMVKAGAFLGVDIAIGAHLAESYLMKNKSSQTIEAVRFKFFENSNPSEGINALDGVVSFFNRINDMRKQGGENDKNQEIVYQGGEALSASDFASVDFHIKSNTWKELKAFSESVKKCAKEAALDTGTHLEIENYEHSFMETVTNGKLSEIYGKNLKLLSIEKTDWSGEFNHFADTEDFHRGIKGTVMSMVLTAVDLMKDEVLLEDVKNEFICMTAG